MHISSVDSGIINDYLGFSANCALHDKLSRPFDTTFNRLKEHAH